MLTVSTMDHEGVIYGVNGWVSNDIDRRQLIRDEVRGAVREALGREHDEGRGREVWPAS